MPKETSKIKALIIFVILEIVIFGISGAVAAIGLSDLVIPKTAIFLGVSIFFHLVVAYTGLRAWKKEQKYPISKGEL